MKKIFNNIKRALCASWMCIRFPFLYPRNRFTGHHYNNWNLEKKLYGEAAKQQMVKGEDGVYHLVTTQSRVPGWNETNRFLFGMGWVYYNLILRPIMSIPTYTEWDVVPEGWAKAFGKVYLRELRSALIQDHILFRFRIMDIKEKWGLLQLYASYATPAVYEIIDKYESLSKEYCIVCGKPSTKISGGWICPYCDEHYPESQSVIETKVNGVWQQNSERP